jgi:hypothetical protein
MRELYKSGVTPQQKLVGVNNKFGNTGVKNQQGTSRIIYDSLPTGTATTFRFFEDSASRNFPYTNTGSDGNKLGVGDTMVIESIEFLLIDTLATGEIVAITSLTNYGFGPTPSNYLTSIFDFEIANNKVIKKLTLTEGSQYYSKSTSPNGTDIELETQIVLPPLLPYILELRIPEAIPAAFAPGATRYIQAQIIGTGGIIAPRTTF